MSYRNEVREVLQKASMPYTAEQVGKLTSFPEDEQRVSTILCQLVQEGEVLRDGEPRSYRYRLNPDWQPSAQKAKRMRPGNGAPKTRGKKPRATPATPAPTPVDAAAREITAAAIAASKPRGGQVVLPGAAMRRTDRDGLLAEARQLQDAVDARVTAIAATDPILRALIAEQKRLQQLIEENGASADFPGGRA